jgi:hypothetical protein
MKMATGKIDFAPLEEVEFHFKFGYFHRQLDDSSAVHSNRCGYICSVGEAKRDRDSEEGDG